MKCKNFLFCGLELKNNNNNNNNNNQLTCSYFPSLCLACDVTFGCHLHIIISDGKECKICWCKQEIFIQFPGCHHFACRNCFRQLCPSATGEEWGDNENNNMDNPQQICSHANILFCPFCIKPKQSHCT